MAADMDVRQRFFPHTQDELKQIASDILRHAKELGATDSATEISEGDGLSVSRAPRRSRDHRAQSRQDGRRDGVYR
jgi:hypothetical protein